jgi:cysteine synthase
MSRRRKHIVRDKGSISKFDLQKMAAAANERGEEFVLVQASGSRNEFERRDLINYGAELIICDDTEDADDTFQRLVREEMDQ